MAFATGAVASYGANVAGSAYLGRVVGGPRRTHRHRDRIARNAVGSWLAGRHAAATTPTTMADLITFGPPGSPTLPVELETLVHQALTDTFDLGRTQPLPDLQLGYRRLVTHLRLLDGFVRPPVPIPPALVWMAKLYSDPQNPPPSLRPQNTDLTGQDGGGVAVEVGPPSPGSPTSGASDSSKAAAGCFILALILILIDLIQAFVQCIGQWANGNTSTFWENMLLSKPWEKDPPYPRDATQPTNPNVTAARLTAIAAGPQAAQLVKLLSDVHSDAWEAMDRAYGYLAVTGLIYPGHLTTTPPYAELTSSPADRPWPRREERDPSNTYHMYPASPAENPVATPSPFPPGARPDVSLTADGQLNASNIALALWRQVAAGDQDSHNRDLDGDRDALHECWAAAGSISDDPVDILVLGYDEQ